MKPVVLAVTRRSIATLAVMHLGIFLPLLAQSQAEAQLQAPVKPQPYIRDTLILRGSDALGAKLVPQWAEAFRQAGHAHLRVDITAEGSDSAYTQLAMRSTRLGMASRAATAEELALLRERGVKVQQVEVARAHIAMLVNSGNEVENLTREQLRDVMCGVITDWSQVGGAPGKIRVHMRNTAAHYTTQFRRLAMEDRDFTPSAVRMQGSDGPAQIVVDDIHAITFAPIVYTHAKRVKALSIAGVKPGTSDPAQPYALEFAHYLIIASDATELERGFVNFALSPAGASIREQIGFLPPR